MTLTRRQKRYINRNYRKTNVENMAEDLKVEPSSINEYLSEIGAENEQDAQVSENKFIFRKWLSENWLWLFTLAMIVLVVYVNGLSGGFVSDDKSFLQLRPGVPLSYFLNPPLKIVRNIFVFFAYKIGGQNTIPYHLVNLLFHFGTVFMVFLIINRLNKHSLGIIAAAVVAVHPIFVESVTWISGGPYVQYGFFLLVSLYFYIFGNFSQRNYWLSFTSFVLALFSSEKAMVFPFILISYELALGNLKKYWIRLVPFCAIAGIWIITYISGVGGRIASLQTEYAQDAGYNNPLIQVPVSLASYIQLILWPDKLTLYHSELMFSPLQYILIVIIVLAYFAWTIYSYFKNKQLFFWLSMFVISLLPTLTPLKVASVVAERYVYLGAIGIIVSFVWSFDYLATYTKNKTAGLITAIVIILLLSIRTISRNIDWLSEDNLWMSAIKTSPSSPNNHNNLGDVYMRKLDLKNAGREFRTAIILSPRYADAYHNLGNVYVNQGEIALALDYYIKATSFNPNIWQSYQNIAVIYFRSGKVELARDYMEKAVNIQPQNDVLHASLGVILLKMNDITKARAAFNRALEINPTNQQALTGVKDLSK